MFKTKNLVALLAVTLLLGLSSCGSSSKKKSTNDEQAPATEQMPTEQTAPTSAFTINSDSDSGKAGNLRTVYFAFNSASLNSDTKSALENNASFLKENANVEVQIEGHCDERGGVQYNLALGEKRSKAVRQYLVSLGVKSSQMTTISFGKERPLSFGHDEASWSKNRRANFVITAK